MTRTLVFLLAGSMASAAAQVSAPSPNTARPPAPASAANLTAAPAVSGSLGKLDQVVENTRVDLARLRVDKWKADSNLKRQAQDNAESVERNLTAALPSLVQQVRANPGSVAATFKLYRNLNALYDVMASLAESAGAFGSKDEYQGLANDTANLDTLRRSLADQLEIMAASRDNEVAQLQARVRQQTAAGAAAGTPPKRIIVDENEPVKKSTKKNTTKKKAASEGQTPPK